MSYARPRSDDELWRRTRPALFDPDLAGAPAPLRLVGPGRTIPGVTVMPLGDAVVDFPADRVGGPTFREHGLSQRLAEEARPGFLVHVSSSVAPGTVVPVDVEVRAASGVVRNRIVVEPGAEVVLVERMGDEGGEQLLQHTGVTIGAGARVTWRRLLEWRRRVYAEVDVEVGADASLELTTVQTGEGLAKVEQRIRLAGAGASVDDLFVDRVGGRFRSDLFQETLHLARETPSRGEALGVVRGRGYSLHHGMTRVAPEAAGADTWFTTRHLVLDGTARADAIPKMEIQTDEVKAGHGATVGDIDSEALFYLMSRGLTREQAEALVIEGFLARVHERFPELAALEGESHEA